MMPAQEDDPTAQGAKSGFTRAGDGDGSVAGRSFTFRQPEPT